MNVPQPHPPPEAPAQPQPPPSPPSPSGVSGESGGSGRAKAAGLGAASLVLAIVGPLSLVITFPATALFTLAAYYLAAPLDAYRLTPFILLSLPVLCGLVSVPLAIAALRGAPAGAKGRSVSVAALWVNGVVFTIGLVIVR